MGVHKDDVLVTDMEPERGGWKTFPFVTASSLAVGMVTYGVLGNMMVYLKKQFHIDSIDATLITSVINGTVQLSPVFAAIISDSWLSCFAVIFASAAASFLGALLFTLTAAVPSLSPPPLCLPGACEAPTRGQLAVLYAASSLMVAGFGGTRFVAAAMGAVQFDGADDRSTFFSWYTGMFYVSVVTGLVGIVYVQDNAGWVWGFGLSAAVSGVGLLVFLSGARHYRHPERKKNPLMGFMRTTVLCKENGRRKMTEEEASDCRFYDRLEEGAAETLTKALIFRSAEQPSAHWEDLKTILRLVPLLSASIVMWISIFSLCSLTLLQALAMDRRVVGYRFSVPVASMTVFSAASAAASVPVLSRAIFPLCHRVTGRGPPTPFQRIGSGLLVATATMACAALVESKRLGALLSADEPAPISWLLPALVLIGLGDALLLPAQLEFYYQAFPESLRSSSTGVNALVGGVGAYMSTAFLATVRRFTGWLQDDVNQSRLDNVYWLLAVMGMLNFGYFLLCTKLYKKDNIRV